MDIQDDKTAQTNDNQDLLAPPTEDELKVHAAVPVANIPDVKTLDNSTVDSLKEQIQSTTETDKKMDELVKLSAKDLLSLNDKAQAFSKQLANFNPADPGFSKNVDLIGNIGQDAVMSIGNINSRFAQEAIKDSMREGGAKAEVGKQLLALRKITDQLTPRPNTFADTWLSRLGLGGVKNYFKQYDSADKQIQVILNNMNSGRDTLERDNSELSAQQVALWKDLGTLKKADELLARVDDSVCEKIDDAKKEGDMMLAGALEKDALFEVRRRHMEIKTMQAVAIQAYMSMGVTRLNNKELIRGIKRAQTTTMVALRTAVVVAGALANQKMVLDTLDAVDKTTNNLIDANSKMLEMNSLRIQQRATKSGVKPETLNRAFETLARTINSIDTFQIEANKAFNETISNLTEQQRKVEPYLERMHKKAIENEGEQATGFSSLDQLGE